MKLAVINVNFKCHLSLYLHTKITIQMIYHFKNISLNYDLLRSKKDIDNFFDVLIILTFLRNIYLNRTLLESGWFGFE